MAKRDKVIFLIITIGLISIGCKPRTDNGNSIESNIFAVGDDNQTDVISITNETPTFMENIGVFDLNGTWLPDLYYRFGRYYEIVESDFSWGKGKQAIYSSFDIDITGEHPFIHPPDMRPFGIIYTEQNNSSIIMHVSISNETPMPDDEYLVIKFNFIDKDSLLIDAKNFHVTYTEGELSINPFDGKEIWRRLSGMDN